MAQRNTRYTNKAVDLSVVLVLLLLILSQYRRKVHAAGEDYSVDRQYGQGFAPPRPSPGPAVTPRPRGTSVPVALPNISSDEKIWVAQGELQASRNSFACRAMCKPSWEGKIFEILQVTRGTEDWMSQQDVFARCHKDTESSYLVGGLWHTPPETPESSLCFIVIRQSSAASDH
jgi:hypothetical protein